MKDLIPKHSLALKFRTWNGCVSVAIRTFLVIKVKNLNKISTFFFFKMKSPVQSVKHCHIIQFHSLTSSIPCVGFSLRFYHWFLRDPVMPPSWYQGAKWGNQSTCFPPPAVPANMFLALTGFKLIIQPTLVAKEIWCWEEPRLSYRCKDSAHRMGLWNSTIIITTTLLLIIIIINIYNLYLPQASVHIFSLILFSGAELPKTL